MSDGIVPKGQPIQGDPEKKGWLFKWTNYLKGYQRRWFVLSNGLLSYYRNQAEMAHTCRGTISLLGALIHTADSCTFVISNGGTQTFHIRAHDEVERQSWVTALELAKAKAIRAQESDDDDDQMSNAAPAAGDGEGEDAGGIARELAARFHDLRTCSELVARHGAALQRSLVDLEIPPSDTTKQVSERATLFRISCNAMMNACSEFMSAAATSSARMSRALQHEREQKMRLQEVVEQLARQHDNLEKNINARGGGNGAGQGNETEDEDHEFFDAVEDGVSTIMDDKTSFVMKVPVSVNRKAKLKSGESSDDSEAETVTETQQAVEKQLRSRDEEPASKRISTEKQTPLVSSAVEKQRRNREEEPASKRISTEKLTAQGSTSPAVEKERRSREEEPASKRISTEKETAQVSSAAVEKERRSREEEPASKRISTDKETAQVSSAVEKERRSREEEPASKLVGTEKLTAQEPTSPVVFVEEAEAESSMAGAAAAADAAGQPPAPAAPPPAPPGAAAAPAALAHTDGQEEKINKDMKIWPHVSAVMSYVDGHPRRTRVPDKPNYPLSLWSIMKNCIGKELSKIPIPVNFSEPLSMLQRLTEEYEYSSVLDQAAQFSDPAHQLAYVAAFTVSSYATTAVRTSKPFNPLLGETYECDRMADLGWRSISEQVSHHPPMVAQWCEGAAGWQCWQEFTMTTKFRGKYLQVIPLGGASAMFPASGNKYTWRKVTTTVHNIIVGKLWVDNHGDMDIVGEAGPAAGYVAHLKYQPYGYFSKDTQRKVTGVIKDPQGVPRYVLQGHWDDRVEVAPVTSASADNTQCKTGKFALAWQRVAEPPDSDKWYNFTLLAAQLNEMENGVAPTDSRVRPDQRLMEEGLWDEANKEKLRLEEKQRAKRRALEAAAEAAAARGLDPAPPPAPAWFTREAVSAPGAPILRHLYNHRYWECKQRGDWAGSPDIF